MTALFWATVAHSNCTWKIVLGHPHKGFVGAIDTGKEGVEMLVRGAVEEETHCTGGISEINLSITSEGVNHLSSFPKQLINNLKELALHYNNRLRIL